MCMLEFDEKVANHKKFLQKNPKYIKVNYCVYVGQSAKSLKLDLSNTKNGIKQIILPNYMG